MARYRESTKTLLGFSLNVDRMLTSIILREQGQPPSLWRPPTDVYETADDVVILVEVAGMDPDQISVEFTDRIMRISGHRQDKHLRAASHCLEVQYGEFASDVYLPGQYDRDAIQASYKDGFLTITLPKVIPEARQISVQGIEE